MSEPLDAVRDLSDAFAARDLGAALACFVPGDDIGYAGSERDETATGRDALTALLGTVFLRDEAYGWTVTGATVHRYGAHAYVLAEADGVVRADSGERDEFPYRVSGVVELVDGRWRWRHCQGSEPQGSEPQGSEPQGSEPQGSEPQGSEPQGSEPQLTLEPEIDGLPFPR